MIFHGGFYYYSESRDDRQIFVRRSRSIAEIAADPGVCVWTAPACGPNSDHVWAPELHLTPGWKGRDVHAKRFSWTSDGFPDFGSPLPRTVSPMLVPSPSVSLDVC